MLEALLHSPTPDALVDLITTHAGRNLILVAGVMELQYDGRAASSSLAGDYLLLLKPDGSLQVQGARAIKPVNWQPVCDDLRIDIQDDLAVLRAERFTPNEVLRVLFHHPALAQALRLEPDTSFTLRGSERDMRDALARHPDWLEPGLVILQEELPTEVGGIDLYARDANGALVVVELKRGKANHEAVHQLQRYVQAVRERVDEPVRGLLAAPDITQPARLVLQASGLEFIELQALPGPKTDVLQPGLFDAELLQVV